MDNLVSQLMGMVGKGNQLKNLSNAIGGSPKATKSAIGMLLPAMLHTLNRNSSSKSGAESLLGALTKDHDGGILSNLGAAISSPDSGIGAGILGHLFGGKRSSVESGVSRATGLNTGQIAQLMITLAPILMGLLGKKKSSKNLDSGGLQDLLRGQEKRVPRRKRKRLSPLMQFLDQDGDGDVTGEAIKIGTGLLGSLFKRR